MKTPHSLSSRAPMPSALTPFDLRSLSLFATLVLAAGLAGAQTTVGPSAPSAAGAASAPAASTPGAQPSRAPATGAIPSNRWTPEQMAEAFKRSDANADGSITRAEAAVWPGLASNFDRVDANGDGNVSRAELDNALGTATTR